ncbi:MAG: permease of the major facilitator superfamily [Acidobacteria bacterium]|nr:permease of the major facilitator superfamily [Acidobacteriota bacterium]
MAHFTRAFRHRNYQLFFAGQLISLTGTWMQSVAESWLVFRLTGSAALLGVTSFFTLAPVFLFATLGGILADRMDRRRILITTQTISMVLPLTLAALTLSGHVRVWHVFVLATCLGIVNAFDIPARQSFVVEMVGREDLTNAIALNSSMVNGARVVGPAIAGLLVAAVGEGWCFLLNGISYLAVIAGLVMMNAPRRPRTVTHRSAWRDTVEGFQFATTTTPIRALLMLLGLLSFAGMPYSVLMPVFAESILGAGPKGLGLLMGASGLGALGGALALLSRRGVRGLGRWVAVSAAAFGLALIGFSLSRTFWLSALLLIPVGAAMMVEMAVSNTLLQAMVPDALRGRVMALYSMMFMGMAPFGALFAGWVAERYGAPMTVALGGVVCLAGGGVFSLRLPKIRNEARELIVAQEMAGGDPPAEMTGTNLSAH